MDASADSQEYTCRYCLESMCEDDVYQVCACRGTSLAVHLDCVQAAYEAKANWSDLTCPSCRQTYEAWLATQLAEIGFEKLQNEPCGTARLLKNVGIICGEADQQETKRDLLQQALHIEVETYGQDHPQLVDTYVTLGNAYGALGDHESKRDLLQRALKICEVHDAKECDIAFVLTNLGSAYGALGDVQRKRDVLERALPVHQRVYGESSQEVGVTLTNLSNAYEALGNAERQCSLAERAVSVLSAALGRDHRNVAVTLMNLGNALSKLCKWEQQRDVSQRALPVLIGCFGSEHEYVVKTFHLFLQACVELKELEASVLEDEEKLLHLFESVSSAPGV